MGGGGVYSYYMFSIFLIINLYFCIIYDIKLIIIINFPTIGKCETTVRSYRSLKIYIVPTHKPLSKSH